MALITAVAGAYTGIYTSNALASGAGAATAVGILADEGYRLSWTTHMQQIGNDGTDQYGQTLLESIYRGADWDLIFRCREYGTGPMNMAWPFVRFTGGGALSPLLVGVGRTVTGYHAGGLVLTAVTGTTAATNPATLTALSCCAAPGSISSLDLTSRLRELPQRFNLYPYSVTISATSYNVWFTTT